MILNPMTIIPQAQLKVKIIIRILLSLLSLFPHFLKLKVSLNQVMKKEGSLTSKGIMYHESYELKAENVKLKRALNKKKTLVKCLELEKNDLNEKLNFCGSQKMDMDCKIKELIVEKEDLIEKKLRVS